MFITNYADYAYLKNSLERRTKLENQLATLLDSGIINTYTDVITTIEKLKI